MSTNDVVERANEVVLEVLLGSLLERRDEVDEVLLEVVESLSTKKVRMKSSSASSRLFFV